MIPRLLFLLPLLLFLGCGPPPITEGTITNKKFVKAHWESVPVTNVDFDGNVTIDYEDEWEEDKWFVSFKNNDNEQSEWRYLTKEVSKKTHDRYEIGDWIEFK